MQVELTMSLSVMSQLSIKQKQLHHERTISAPTFSSQHALGDVHFVVLSLDQHKTAKQGWPVLSFQNGGFLKH